MRVITITDKVIKNTEAKTYSKNGKLYFNIKHGGWEKGLWRYSVGMDITHFKPSNQNDVLELNNNNYTLIPVIKGERTVKDKQQNNLYFISKDDSEFHKDDYLVFWEIPNRNYVNVKYELSGDVNELGSGWNGRCRGDKCYKSPAPVLEVYGDCNIKWTAFTLTGEKLEQVISFTDGKWILNPIESITNVQDN